MKGKIISALLVEQGVPARRILIENTQEVIRDILGGDVCLCKYWDDNAVVLRNQSIPPTQDNLNRAIFENNRIVDVIPGSFIICGQDASAGLTGLSGELLFKYTVKFHVPDRFQKIGDGYGLLHTELEKRGPDEE